MLRSPKRSWGPRRCWSALAIATAVVFTVWNTTYHGRPFVVDSITLSVLSSQLYSAVASLLTLCLAAVVWERENFAAGLDASRGRLVKAADTERRRIEHNSTMAPSSA